MDDMPPRTFPGRGHLRCRACDRPYIEHAIGPCPALNGERITVVGNRSENYEAQKQRARRRAMKQGT